MNVVETETKKSSLLDASTTHVELIDSEGNSSVDSFNGSECYVVSESGSCLSVSFKLPSDESAPAFVYSLMLGGNIETVKSHRTNEEGVVTLTIKHDIQMVSDWTISGNVITIKFLTESSVVINGDISIEEESSDSSN